MNLRFKLNREAGCDVAQLIIAPNQGINEQILQNELSPMFYRVTPGLDDESGKLIPGYKIEETLVGPRWMLSESKDDELNHIEGILVHTSKLDETIKELEKLGFEIETE